MLSAVSEAFAYDHMAALIIMMTALQLARVYILAFRKAINPRKAGKQARISDSCINSGLGAQYENSIGTASNTEWHSFPRQKRAMVSFELFTASSLGS